MLECVTAFNTCPHIRWGVYRHESGDLRPSQIDEQDRIATKYIAQSRFKFGNGLGQAGFDAVKPRPLAGVFIAKPLRDGDFLSRNVEAGPKILFSPMYPGLKILFGDFYNMAGQKIRHAEPDCQQD
jgi:hypothetical protein